MQMIILLIAFFIGAEAMTTIHPRDIKEKGQYHKLSPEELLKHLHEAVESHYKHKGEDMPHEVKEAFKHLKEEAHKHKEKPEHHGPPPKHIQEALKAIKEHIHKHNVKIPPHVLYAIKMSHHCPATYDEFQKEFHNAVDHGEDAVPKELKDAVKYFQQNGYDVYGHPPPENIVTSIREYGPKFPMFPLIALATSVKSFLDHNSITKTHFGVNDTETKQQQTNDKMCLPVPFLDKALEGVAYGIYFPHDAPSSDKFLEHGQKMVPKELQGALKYFQDNGYDIYSHPPAEDVVTAVRTYAPNNPTFPLVALATSVESFHKHNNIGQKTFAVNEAETKEQQLADKFCAPVPFLTNALEGAFFAIHFPHCPHGQSSGQTAKPAQ